MQWNEWNVKIRAFSLLYLYPFNSFVVLHCWNFAATKINYCLSGASGKKSFCQFLESCSILFRQWASQHGMRLGSVERFLPCLSLTLFRQPFPQTARDILWQHVLQWIVLYTRTITPSFAISSLRDVCIQYRHLYNVVPYLIILYVNSNFKFGLT